MAVPPLLTQDYAKFGGATARAAEPCGERRAWAVNSAGVCVDCEKYELI